MTNNIVWRALVGGLGACIVATVIAWSDSGARVGLTTAAVTVACVSLVVGLAALASRGARRTRA